MGKDLKAMLAKKLSENTLRHANANNDLEFDSGKQYAKILLDLIDPNPYQPRKLFPQEELAALASSISESGLMQPISVRKTGERYQIIAGERRVRAIKLLGRHSIEALISDCDESDMAVLALAENIDREDLSDYEIGKALRQVETIFPTKKKLAESLGMNREDMYRYYAFESLPELVKEKLEKNPRLLSRTAAVDLKRLLQRWIDTPNILTYLSEALSLLESGELEQSKLAPHLSRVLSGDIVNRNVDNPSKWNFIKDGRTVGFFTRTTTEAVLRLSKNALSNEQEKKLCAFIEELLRSSFSSMDEKIEN